MNLIVKSPVWDDLRAIGLRIAEDNPDAAERFLTAAEAAFELLRQHPRIGRLRSFSVPACGLG
jgi:plasmid stabilization system protein ParE